VEGFAMTGGRRAERTLYRETYANGGMKLHKDALPELRHRSEGGKLFRARECEIMAAGKIERADGTILEYHDLRVYLEPI
jgi:hypothetical protein